MRVQFFIQGARVPSGRFRVLQYIPYLEGHGVRCRVSVCRPDFYSGPKRFKYRLFYHLRNLLKLLSRLPGLVMALRSDVVFVQREIVPGNSALLERWLSRRRRPVFVYDFDDSIYLLYGPSGQANKIDRILAASDLVIAGNSHLADHAKRFCSKVEILPTSVDIRAEECKAQGDRSCEAQPSRQHERFVIGWSGTYSNIDYLRAIGPAISAILEKNPQVVVRILCNAQDGVAPPLPFPHEFVEWTPTIEAETLRSFDCGLMPLADDQWTRGKCSFKVLLYFAYGVAAVASPVGNNCQVIEDGVNGFWASTNHEWQARMQELIDSPALRQRLANNGYRSLCERYSTEVCSQRLLAFLEEAVAAKS